ncbi:histidine ammonia-lyase [Kitasatospora sp. NBC_00374]|uniref:HAL/PAL/TAL family ammonia-lyase n=1 Tax=Kitasatospora sp. NBC_00374 TaxID=2975964 RepID=UPI00325134E0
MSTTAHELRQGRYNLAELGSIVDTGAELSLSGEVSDAVATGAAFVRELAVGPQHVYGVNTGFGALCETRVAPEQVNELQYNHVVSHAAGVGEPASPRVSRLAMLIKLLTFRTGITGIGRGPIDRLIELWNTDLIPVIPSKGTVGASGDLSPLAHLSLPLLGLGEVWIDGERRPGAVLGEQYGLEPVTLAAKEGLALTNGVQYITAHAVDSLLRIAALVDFADAVAGLSSQAFSTSDTFAHGLYHTSTAHEDRKTVARNLRAAMLGGNHHTLDTANKSKQDPYSFRCIPQVHGAIRQVVNFAWKTIEDEVNSVSDNPLFFAEEEMALFGGNLHGESVAFSLDMLAIAVSELANISERRTYQLHSGRRGLPDFLVANSGVNSGLMIAQYTSAALVNESKTLSHPASVDTIPTCQLQEDHVSMGGTSAYKLRTIIDNCEYVLGIELLSAAQAAELLPGLELSEMGRDLLAALRKEVDFLDSDRVLATDLELARQFVAREAGTWSRRIRQEADRLAAAE